MLFNIIKYLKKEDEYVFWEVVDISVNIINYILLRFSFIYKYLEVCLISYDLLWKVI